MSEPDTGVILCQAPRSWGDLMANALLDALGWVGESLDKPGRTVRGLLAGRPDELMNLVPFSDTMGLTDPTQSVSGRGLLEQYGMLRPKEEGEGFGFGDLAGVAAEVATDPMNLVGGALLRKLLNSQKAYQASMAGAKAGLLRHGADPEDIFRALAGVEQSGTSPLLSAMAGDNAIARTSNQF